MLRRFALRASASSISGREATYYMLRYRDRMLRAYAMLTLPLLFSPPIAFAMLMLMPTPSLIFLLFDADAYAILATIDTACRRFA